MSEILKDRDRLRQWVTLLLASLLPLVGALAPAALGIGRPIARLMTAAATAEGGAAPAMPAAYAWLIWTPILALAVGYGVWQALPARRADPLLRRVGWWVAAAFAGCLAWLLAAQFSAQDGWHLALLMLCGALLPALVAFLRELRGGPDPAPDRLRLWLLRPLLGLLAGWLTVAAFAGLSGAARAEGVAWFGLGDTAAAVLLVLLAGLLAAGMLWLSRGSPWYGGGAAWGFVAILLANMGERSWNLFVAAAAAAVLVLLGVALRAAWRRADRRDAVAAMPAAPAAAAPAPSGDPAAGIG